MRIAFIGAVRFSGAMLEVLIRAEANVVGVCTTGHSAFNADHQDLSGIARLALIPVLDTPDINSQDTLDWISALAPDVIFCFGWSRLIKAPLLAVAPMGVVGYHPAALPANRGRHPLIWALALGMDETGSSFFFMDEGADSGDILSQHAVPIDPADDAGTLYSRMIDIASIQLVELLGALQDGTFSRAPQNQSLATYWRKRSRLDSQIDWRMSGQTIHNLARALAHPYPGAHFVYRQNDVKVWRTEIVEYSCQNIEPGKILAVGGRGPIVKAGADAVRLIEIEPAVNLVAGEYL